MFDAKDIYSINEIGVIADIQYCDRDDGPNFDGTEFRRYRESLNVTKRAAKSFQAHDVGAVIQLGDAIDGHSKDFLTDFNETLSAILDIPSSKDNSIDSKKHPQSIPRFDVLGNHELYSCSRSNLHKIFDNYDQDNDMQSYSREIAGGKWRLIVLDSYAISVLGYNDGELSEQELKKLNYAKTILEHNNPNCLSQHSNGQVTPKEKQRYDKFNGGLGQVQLKWLEKQLDDARDKRQFVAIFSHIPISGFHGNEYLWNSLHWDADEILQLIKRKGSHVVACIAGHRHSFSHRSSDEYDTFTHHLVIPSPLLAPVDGEAHAILEFSVEKTESSEEKGMIRVKGFGLMPKDIDLLKPAPTEWQIK